MRQLPFSLPASFEWDTLDLSDESQVEEVYKLLNENYGEDEDNMFRFDYSSEFLQWALRPPGNIYIFLKTFFLISVCQTLNKLNFIKPFYIYNHNNCPLYKRL